LPLIQRFECRLEDFGHLHLQSVDLLGGAPRFHGETQRHETRIGIEIKKEKEGPG
jgi:hypothetical protein